MSVRYGRCCAGVLLLDPPYSAVYRGLWGVNGLLSMWAVGAHAFVLSWHSVAAGAACVALGAGLQAALEPPLRTVSESGCGLGRLVKKDVSPTL